MTVFLLLVLAIGSLSGCSSESSKEEIIVTGSTTVLPIAEISAEDFQAVHPDISVLVSGRGSSEGIEAVATGTSDIGTSSRDLKDNEADLGLVDTPIAYDGIAVIVNTTNPVKDLTHEQLRDIYSGKITNWKEVGGKDLGIDLVNRDEASGTREAFKKIVMGDTEFELHAAVLPGTGQVRDVISRSPGAIGYISAGFVESSFTRTKVSSVTVDGVSATEENVASGAYPISRELHMFTKGEPSGIVKEYLDYVCSDKIQDTVVKDAGFVPVSRGKGGADGER